MIPAMIVFLFVSAGQAGPPQVASKLVRVFVHTDDGGQAAELGGRRESVKDVSAWLADKKKDLVIVKDEDQADVVVEIVERTFTVPKVIFGMAGRPGQPVVAPARVVHLEVSLTQGAATFEFTNKNAPLEAAGGWRSAADDVAKQIHKWIVDHRAQILADR